MKKIFISAFLRYTASSAVVGKAGKHMKDELPLIRIKARYQTVQILPMENYHDLIQVQNNVFQKDLILYNLESKPGGLSR